MTVVSVSVVYNIFRYSILYRLSGLNGLNHYKSDYKYTSFG